MIYAANNFLAKDWARGKEIFTEMTTPNIYVCELPVKIKLKEFWHLLDLLANVKVKKPWKKISQKSLYRRLTKIGYSQMRAYLSRTHSHAVPNYFEIGLPDTDYKDLQRALLIGGIIL